MMPVSEPFCDFFSLSLPCAGDDAPPIVETVILFLSELDCHAVSEGVYELGGYGGTVMSKRRGLVWLLSFTGSALRSIREAGLLKELVMLLHEVPHRVTRLDASCDYAEDAPTYLSKQYYRIRRASIVIGRKVISYRDVERHTSVNHEGRAVHNLYLGKKTSEVRVLLYDKQHERVSKGFPDPGQLLRIEVRLRSQVGCSVFDALAPERLYYHYAAPALCELPASVRPWMPDGQGFELPQQQAQCTPYQRLKSLIGESAVIDQMLKLSQREGAGGLQSVYTLLQRKLDTLTKAKASKLSLVL
jgi:Replication initiation factor.